MYVHLSVHCESNNYAKGRECRSVREAMLCSSSCARVGQHRQQEWREAADADARTSGVSSGGSSQCTQPGMAITTRRTIHSPWRAWWGGKITVVGLMLLVLPAMDRLAAHHTAAHAPETSYGEQHCGSMTSDGEGGQNADQRCAVGALSVGVPVRRRCQTTVVDRRGQPSCSPELRALPHGC